MSSVVFCYFFMKTIPHQQNFEMLGKEHLWTPTQNKKN